jgi:hypothetical protein
MLIARTREHSAGRYTNCSFCLDNSSFLAANGVGSREGGMVPISKCVEEDDREPVLSNVYGAPELIPRNEFRLPMQPGGPVR